MGRCYEFGVSFHDECEQAMVVPGEGGHCICASCGADCPGQFNGCASVVAIPGYVPVNAPEWAKPGSAKTRAAAPPAAAAMDAPAAIDPPERHILDVDRFEPRPPARAREAVELHEVGAELASVRSLLEALLERPERIVDAVALLNRELKVRDGELAAAFARMTSAYEQLTREVAEDRDARLALAQAIDRLGERVASMEQASNKTFFGFNR